MHIRDRPGSLRLYERLGISDLFTPARWFVERSRQHAVGSGREHRELIEKATGPQRDMEEMRAAFLAGPVRRVAHYAAVHAIYGAFDVGLRVVCKEVAEGDRQPRRSPALSRYFDFVREEARQRHDRNVTIPADEHIREFVEAFVEVRHCVAHAMGDVTLMRSEATARAAVERLGLAVSDDGFITMTDDRCAGLFSDATCVLAAIIGDIENALAPRMLSDEDF